VIVVIAVIGMGAIFVAGGNASKNITSLITSSFSSSSGQTQTTTANTNWVASGPAPSGFSESVLQTHIANVNARNVIAAVADYTPTATMIWEGNTQGLGGTYTGSSNIRFTYQTAIGGATALSYTLSNFTASGVSGNANAAIATATENFTGSSTVLGNFHGSIQATYDYVNQGGKWLIEQETSNYQSFNTQFSLGATTFPQWQVSGPPLPFRYSESPFKNFVYYYGGALAAIAIAGYLASLPLVVYVRKKRGSNRSNENRTQ
jgi:hypothetical protein